MARCILYRSILLAVTLISLQLAAVGQISQPVNTGVVGAAPSPPRKLILNGKVLGKLVPAQPGEICIVCNKPLGKGDVVYLADGQRVPLHVVECYGAFVRDPQEYMQRLRPYEAFLGVGGEEQRISWIWFLAGIYVLVGLVFAAACAHRALETGRSPGGWFAAGLFLNAFGYLLLLTRPVLGSTADVPSGLVKLPVTYSPEPCPACGKPHHPSAAMCPHCGAKLQATVVSEVEKAGLPGNGRL